MTDYVPYSLNLGGHLLELTSPQVMGILNLTPDSFYAPSRTSDEAAVTARVRQILDEGGTMIDVGAYSSRPGADDVSPEEEMRRLRKGLAVLRKAVPDAVVSVDTFRSDVARMCVEEFGVQMINDISGGELDAAMFKTVAALHVPYILMHMKGTPQTMQEAPRYEHFVEEVFLYFARKVQQLHELGVCDIVLDPGFGFGKTLGHNYELMNRLEDFREFGLPVLVGVSRKSMVYHLLATAPENALNGTTALHTVALMKGAHVLRVHDVKEAVECVKIVDALRRHNP